ncbi:hypothetical protein F4779DRAFT_628052 [Xylariaceae sp. FL0662B]|nr:hypothetical protein F4779DRAFT_628052 [Xylariaceae sp. FL0662B]
MVPVGMPPDGILSNFENPETLIAVLISICVIMTVITVTFTFLGLFATRRKMWWSDYFVTIAVILLLGHTGLMLAQTSGIYTKKILFSQEIILSSVLLFSQVSIFLLFHQIFEVKKSMRIAIRFGIIFSSLLCFTNIPLSAALSAPHVEEIWDNVLTSGRPEKQLIWGVVQSIFGVMLGLFTFTLPIPVIMRLHLSTKKKIQLLAVFITGVVGVIASVLSLVYRVEAMNTNDGTWKYTPLLICSVVETDVAIIVSSMPGVANFARVYLSMLKTVKSLRLTLYRNRSGNSGFRPINHKEDPNRPKGCRKPADHDVISHTFILKSASSTEKASNSSQIIRAVDILQETYNLSSMSATGVQESQIHNYLTGKLSYGPTAVQPPTESIWFYYIPL